MFAGTIVFFTILLALAAGILSGYGVLSFFLFMMSRTNREPQNQAPAMSTAPQTAS